MRDWSAVPQWRATVGCPSGQREQTVNLPADAYEGSNPSPTITTASQAFQVDRVAMLASGWVGVEPLRV